LERYEVNPSIRALITRVKSPRVRIMKGNVKNFTIGLIRALMRPKISPIIMTFHHSPVKVIPSTSFTAAAIDRALIIILRTR